MSAENKKGADWEQIGIGEFLMRAGLLEGVKMVGELHRRKILRERVGLGILSEYYCLVKRTENLPNGTVLRLTGVARCDEMGNMLDNETMIVLPKSKRCIDY